MATSTDNIKGDKVVTPRGRLSYPRLFERAKSLEDGKEGKYEVTFLIPKATDVSALREAVEAVARQAFPGKYKDFTSFKNPPIRDGDEMGGECLGHWVLKPRSGFRPGVVMADRRTIEQYMADENISDHRELVYGGCYARLSVVPSSYVKAGNWGVTFYLQNVQWLGHGDKFGGTRSAQDDFDALEAAVAAAEDNL